ncbi:MAG: hypothetical protein GXO82_04460, partial [Chlorobi bacterium]|nr:hypothetical protein [Chlorobiota bacterium]
KDNLVPKPEVCVDCHDEPDVRGFWNLTAHDPLDKSYITPVDRGLYFNHKRHTDDLAMECTVCHAGITVAENTAGRNPYPSMETCTSCHNSARAEVPATAAVTRTTNATGTCENCHVTLAGLIPTTHRRVNWQKNHGRIALMTAEQEKCASCHSTSFCQECHAPGNIVPFPSGEDNFAMPFNARPGSMDDGKNLTLQFRHSLNYRYTHGFDARAQSSRCTTCHERESFCTPCHQNGLDGNGARILPQSHQLAGWASVPIPGTSSLNRHARAANMDLESCVTCHDVQGQDPVCAVCHSSGVVPR